MYTLEYLAGFFDGEGSIHLKHRDGIPWAIQVAVGNTDFAVLEEFRRRFGGNIFNDEYPSGIPWRRKSGRWITSTAADVLFCLRTLLPRLRQKHFQARLGIDFAETVSSSHSHGVPGPIRRRRNLIGQTITMLNRGVRGVCND